VALKRLKIPPKAGLGLLVLLARSPTPHRREQNRYNFNGERDRASVYGRGDYSFVGRVATEGSYPTLRYESVYGERS
jgi:hypothetical protein